MVHTFQLAKNETRLRIIVRDIDGQPLAGKKYKLTVEGEVHEGVLPNDALLDQPIPADAMQGELKVWGRGELPEFPGHMGAEIGPLGSGRGLDRRSGPPE
jgi:hypothetical protein